MNKLNIKKIIFDLLLLLICTCGMVLIIMFFLFPNEETDVLKEQVDFLVRCLFNLTGLCFLLYRIYEIVVLNRCPYILQSDDVQSSKSLGDAVISTELVKDSETNELNKRINSAHEAGHIIAAYFLNIKVSTAVASSTEGYTRLSENKHFSGKELLDYIKMIYAGTAAEVLLMGKHYDGGYGGQNSDFYRASRMIENYIFMKYPDVGKYDKNPELYLCASKIAGECFSAAKMLLKRHMDELQKIYDFLMVNETVNENQIKEILVR